MTGSAEIETGTLDPPRGSSSESPNPSYALRRLCLVNKKDFFFKKKNGIEDKMSDINFAAQLSAASKLSLLGTQTHSQSQALCLSCKDRASSRFP